MNKWLTLLPLLLIPLSLFGHGGHGISDGNSIYHYLINPAHNWLIILAVVFIWVLAKNGAFKLKKE